MNYYNGGYLFSLDAFIAMTVGNRSTGKSFYVKKQCIARFLKYGEQFIYMRRRELDIRMVCKQWFSDIGNKFPEYYTEHKNNTFYLCRDYIDSAGETQTDRQPCGYTTYLDGITRLKSVPRESVTTIFFDEFLPDNNVYLHREDPFYEPEMLMNLYLSVARGYKQVIRPNVRIICVSNNISMFNPYFTYFNVDIVHKDKYFKNGIYAEKWINYDVVKAMEETQVGAFLSKTRYGKHAIYNESLKDIETNIAKPPKLVYPLYCVHFHQWYTFFEGADGNVYIKASNDKTMKRRFKLLDSPDVEGVPWFKGELVKSLMKMADKERIYYDSMATKSVFGGIFNPKGVIT